MESHLSGDLLTPSPRQGDQAPGRQPLALLNSAMTGAVSPRGGARSRLRAAVRLASFWQFCSRYEKLVRISTYACGCRYLLSKVFGSRVAFVTQQSARICRSSRASGATLGRREPNLSLRRMHPLRENPARNGARRLPWCPEQARTRWCPEAAHARRAHSK